MGKMARDKEDFACVCEICGNSFSNGTYLRRHIKDRHTVINEEHKCCPKCHVKFKDLKTLWNHILSKHETNFGNVIAIASITPNQDPLEDNDGEAVEGEITEGLTSWADGKKCVQCDKTFSNMSGLRRHLKNVHSIDWNLLQDGKGPNQNAAILKSLEDPLPEFSCIVCNLEFISAEGETRHRRNVHGILPESELPADVQAIRRLFSVKSSFRCKECGEKFRKLSSLENHFLEVHRDNVNYLSCQTCDLEFISVRGIVRHKKNVHGIIDPDVPDEEGNYPVKCKYCTSVVIYKDYKAHVRELHNEHYNELVQYLKKKEMETQSTDVFTCKICQKTFNDQKSYKRHVKNVHALHSNEFACTECGKEFKDSSGLRDHLVVHQKLAIEPYIKGLLKEIFGTVCNSQLTCSICQTVTTSTFEARIHVYIKHPEEFKRLVTNKARESARNASFPCPVCVTHFPTVNDIIAHIESSHPENEVPKCHVCGHKELKERDMNLHYQRFHPKTSRHVCKVCGDVFNQVKLLRRHVACEHSGEGVQCPYCPEKHVKVKLHVTVKHPERAEEYSKMVADAIREECHARMEFNHLIDGSVPREPSKKKKKKKSKRIAPTREIVDDEGHLGVLDEDEEELLRSELRDIKVPLVAPVPPVVLPQELYKIEKSADKHLIQVHRLSPPPQQVQPESDPLLMEDNDFDYSNDLQGEDGEDVKPSVEDLACADLLNSAEDLDSQSEGNTNAFALNVLDKSVRICLRKLSASEIEKWKSLKKSNVSEVTIETKEMETAKYNFKKRRRRK